MSRSVTYGGVATRGTSRLPLIAAQLDEKTLEGVVELGERVVDRAQERVAVESGDLRDSIHLEIDGNQVWIVAGDSKAYYGHIVENGGVFQPAQPFLVPSFEEERGNLEELVGERLEEL